MDVASLADPATYAVGVPYSDLARLRQNRPVVRVDEVPLPRHCAAGRVVQRGRGFWLVTRHQAVVAVSRDPAVYSSARGGAFLTDPRSREDLERARELLINMDPPRHALMRRIVSPVFTPRMVSRLEQDVRAHAERLVAGLLGAGDFDAVTDLAAELPLFVLADLLGIPAADRGLLYRWSNNLVGFDDPEFGGGDIDAFRRTFVDAFAYAMDLADDRRRRPREDLVTLLATAEVDGHRLTDRQFCHLWILLVVAGNETTRNLLAGSLQALAEWPDERRRVCADPGLLPGAVEELLRWVTPIMQFRRTAARATVLGGEAIAEGDKVVLSFTSANRDEDVFDAPDRLNLGRWPNPHVAFGAGPHFCIGAHLARLEALAALRALLPHLDRFELTRPPLRLTSNFMNGIKSMPARFARRQS